jgi:hypothetical protein
MSERSAVGGAAGTSAVADDVASPCINVCQMSPTSGLCKGCFRTIDEIASWSMLSPGEKRFVLAALPLRRARR